ncbi:MAG TPA: GNAT family N-acetyltransferase [Gammaproteobacteria bacterium]|nr:GNAT family N-acetyltransferase [Gammaproteobacteria bacterium]
MKITIVSAALQPAGQTEARSAGQDPDTAIAAIRHAVFSLEQGIDATADLDGRDTAAIHALAEVDGHAVGTGRLLPDGHIGRLAVLRDWRGRGIGTALLEALVEAARRQGLARVYLGAQAQATGFYEKHGFRACGEPYVEVGITHLRMERRL